MESRALTQVLRMLSTEHKCRVLLDGRFGVSALFLDTETIIGEGNSWFELPGSAFVPLDYIVRRIGHGFNVSIRCRSPQGLVYTGISEQLEGIISIYHFYIESWDIKSFRLELHHHEDNFNTNWRKIPEPDEEGNYVIVESGGYTKPCRK